VTEISLVKAVETFAGVTQALSDEDLEREWSWKAYNEGIRFAFFRTYEELRSLAAVLITERFARGKPITTAQQALAQYHTAYRDLQAVLLGLDDQVLDVPPAEGEWPLRVILGHILAAEREFFARIWYAVQHYRKGVEEPVQMSDEKVAECVGEYDEFERTVDRLSLPGILAYYDSFHKRVLRELADIRAYELETLSLWWEGIPMPVQFRLHRLDSHLRQHTVQAEKTLEALGYPYTEAQRLLRLIYAALADVDGVIIGAWALGRDQRQELAVEITNRAEQIKGIVK
jgi:hypothetical protein